MSVQCSAGCVRRRYTHPVSFSCIAHSSSRLTTAPCFANCASHHCRGRSIVCRLASESFSADTCEQISSDASEHDGKHVMPSLHCRTGQRIALLGRCGYSLVMQLEVTECHQIRLRLRHREHTAAQT